MGRNDRRAGCRAGVAVLLALGAAGCAQAKDPAPAASHGASGAVHTGLATIDPEPPVSSRDAAVSGNSPDARLGAVDPGPDRYPTGDGLSHDDAWSMFVDRDGSVWAGTFGGACRLEGSRFEPFALPPSPPDPDRGVWGPHLVRHITQDRAGNLWFATGGGAYRYDGRTLRHVAEKDGLTDLSVNCILEDRAGRIWFATHYRGVFRLEGESVSHVFAVEGRDATEAWHLYEDRAGGIWFPVEHFGLFRYDGTSVANYFEDQGLDSGAVQHVTEDRAGRLWAGGYLGLYRREGEAFVHVGRDGPW